jgi:deoxyribonuclease-4
MFTRSSNRWDSRDLTEQEITAFRQAIDETQIHPIVAHSSYLINLASPDETLWERSLGALIIELRRCQQLGIRDYVLHPGSHKGTDEEQGLRRVADALTRAYEHTSGADVTVLLETTAGQGDSLGSRFEHLAWLLGAAAPRERLGACLDTAHVLAAGYEYRDAASYAAMWRAFDAVIGREALRAIHINDSKRDLGSQVDRHEQLGQGFVGIEALRLLVNDRSLWHVPMILETPKGPEMAEDIANLALLRSLVNGLNDSA